MAEGPNQPVALEDPTKGIAHSPLSEQERKDPLVAIKNLPGYVTTAFGRWYQDKVREGGGTPDTSNKVVLAAVGKTSESIGEAAMHGGMDRAKKQLDFWKQNGVVIPEKMEPSVRRSLAVAFVGLNVAEAGVLLSAGQEPYKQLLDLETKGGVVDWAGGPPDSAVSGQAHSYEGPGGATTTEAKDFWGEGRDDTFGWY